MNRHSEKLLASGFLALSSAVLFFLLTGCGTDISLPDVQPTPAQVSPGAISGSVYGGHAPLVGAHVFIRQAATTSYGAKSTSLMQPSVTATGYYGNTFPSTRDLIGANSPTYTNYYVTTDSRGAFYLSSSYTCTAGYPVFLYASGGSAQTTQPVQITGATGTIDTAGNQLITFTTTGTNLLYQGESVTLGTFAPATTAYQTYAGTTHVVSPLNLTTTTFAFEYGASSTTIANAAFTSTATQATIADNPAIVNIALLGICPSSAPYSFATGSSNPIPFVYMNEVSTVAAAYAMAGFTAVSSSQNDALHFGASSTNLLGLQNAALNAGNLYDIKGSVQGTGGDGDTHIARVTTPAGNGTVPQTTINTIANILASCEDSANTYNAATATGGTQSTQCATLFNNATSDGTLTGTTPNDTATAAINIATHPSGNTSNASFVSNLFNAQTGNAPFQPSLATAPNDFAVAIHFNYGNSGGSNFAFSLATDSQGNVWVADTSRLAKVSPLGAVLVQPVNTNSFGVAIDPSDNAWVTNGSSINQFTSAGAAVYSYTAATSGNLMTTPYGIAIDGQGNVVSVQSSGTILTIHGSGSGATYSSYNVLYISGNVGAEALAISSASTSYQEWTVQPLTSPYAVTGYTSTGAELFAAARSNPYAVAFDASGNAWIPQFNATGSLLKFNGSSPYSSTTFSGGGLAAPSGVAVDGAGNVWTSNQTVLSGHFVGLSEFNNAGVAITGTYGYANWSGVTFPITMDQSGNVWVGDGNGDKCVAEYIGAGAPTVEPLSVATNTNKLGTRP